MPSFLSLAVVCSLVCSTLAAPWGGWNWWTQCNSWNMKTRVDFASMPSWERKAYTDSIKCLMSKPSQLDPAQYPAAINRYFDYAVIHVERTQQVHLSGFFLTWHRHFEFLFEQDLRNTCGYWGRFPYWDVTETTNDIHNNPVFDGSAYSMSGDGTYNNTGPIPLGPNLVIPHGSGGGCVTSGPFANLITPLAFIDPLALVTGQLPPNPFLYSPWCLTRDLNQYVAQQYTNRQEVVAAAHAPNASALELALNGIIGGNSLGIHSGAHFSVGGGHGQMSSIHVSPQDPIWWPMHTYIDLVYTSYQTNNPAKANDLYGTQTALNNPPSPPVTLDTVMPDWGYFDQTPYKVGDLISTTAGPYCYKYDNLIS